MKKNLALSLLFIFPFVTWSQLESQFNSQVITFDFESPSAAGYSMLSVADARYKSTGGNLDDAPQKFLAQFSAPIMNNMGVGAKVLADKYGYYKKSGVAGSYAYHTNISNFQTISFGAEVSVLSTSSYLNEMKSQQGTDQTLEEYNENQIGGNIGLGVQYVNKDLYIGIDACSLVENNSGYSRAFKFRTHYVFNDLINKVIFYPSLYMEKSETHAAKYAGEVVMKYMDFAVLNLKYSSNTELTIGGGVLLKDMLFFNYVYNYVATPSYSGTLSSHEIGLTVNLPFQKGKTVNRGFSLFDNRSSYNQNLKSHH